MMRAGFILTFIIALAACTKNNYCIQPQAVTVRCGFYYKDISNQNADTLLDRITIYTTDTTYRYYEDVDDVGGLNYYINAALNQQQVIINKASPNIKDTITINYTPSLKFISNGCGYQYEYLIDNVTSTNYLIEEVNITNASANSQSTTEHLEIIFK